MANQVALYPRLAWSRVRSQVQYRMSFTFLMIGSFFTTFSDFIAILIIFQHLPALGGWSLEEVAFLYGSAYISFKATDAVVGHLDTLPTMVRSGTFDVVLIRPLGSLYQMITQDFALRHVGGVTQGIAILVYAMTQLSIDWDIGRVVVFVLMLISAGFIFGSIWVMGSSTVFWTGGNGLEFLNSITYGGNQLVQYPLNIYAGWLRRMIAFVIPLGFANYFPALYILDRPDPLNAPEFLRFMSPVVAIAMVLLARWVWNQGVRHYRSTGS